MPKAFAILARRNTLGQRSRLLIRTLKGFKKKLGDHPNNWSINFFRVDLTRHA